MFSTLIARLNGMNVHNDLQDSRYGIWIVISVSVFYRLLVFFCSKEIDGFDNPSF